jgi:hypothetical protein
MITRDDRSLLLLRKPRPKTAEFECRRDRRLWCFRRDRPHTLTASRHCVQPRFGLALQLEHSEFGGDVLGLG